MRYFKEIDGVELIKDVYSEQFSTELRVNYKVLINQEQVDEDECPKNLSKRIRKMGNRLIKIANFLDKKNG